MERLTKGNAVLFSDVELEAVHLSLLDIAGSPEELGGHPGDGFGDGERLRSGGFAVAPSVRRKAALEDPSRDLACGASVEQKWSSRSALEARLGGLFLHQLEPNQTLAKE